MGQKQTLLFLDASVMVSASHSPSGGSSLIIEVCQGGMFRAVLSSKVILEARVNIAEKFGETELLRFYQQLAGLEPEIVPPSSSERLAQCTTIVGEKDAHVLAAALDCGADYLLTLDRRHLITTVVLNAGLPLRVITPGEFLKKLLQMN